ncbi:MAG: coenzyme F420-0:L-glutamate ligase [Nitrososphaerales archaeon]
MARTLLQKNKELGIRSTTERSSIYLIPLAFQRRFGKFDLTATIWHELRHRRLKIRNGDILIVSSKFAAMSEGRFIWLNDVRSGRLAREIASRFAIESNLSQLVINESEEIFGGIPGFVLASAKGVLAPNAGIDRSNVPAGYAILYPKDPNATSEKLRTGLLRRVSASRAPRNGRYSRVVKNLGIVLSDSRVTPMRLGTTGVAIAASGFESIEDLRGSKDLFGNELKVTQRALADQLASAGQLLMGESTEAIPVVIIRGAHVSFREGPSGNMTIEKEKCLIIQGLKGSSLARTRKPNHKS